ncbi:MAG: halovibrin HvnA [Pseudomonas sp.]
MKAYFTIFLLLALTACSTTQKEPRTSSAIYAPTSQSTRAAQGAEAAAQLTRWYNLTNQNCGTAIRPSFLCSGVMIRATETNPLFLPWDPSPGSEASGGVSFSWLRKDNGFSKMVYGYINGLIFYPSFETPKGKNDDIEILCTFPHDGATNARPQQGCGANGSFPATSKPCNEQNINTAQLWIERFNAAKNKYHDQCGWNVREGQPDSANRFNQNILARGLMHTANWATQNELRLATWPTGSGASLPIQSFFYLAGSKGLNNARNDQSRYWQNYEQFVPIIQVTLPTGKGGTASFVYNEDDQGTIDPGPAAAQR